LIRKALKILKATVGLSANREELIPQLPFPLEVKSPLTAFRRILEIPYSDNLDGYLTVEDEESTFFYEKRGEQLTLKGPLLRLTREASDLRYSLWGNLGVLYRFSLFLLEKKHHIYNFHACALYDEPRNRLFLIIGGAGSGKTVYLLSGLSKGLKLFSTETVHVRIKDDRVTWFMGSLVDNVRWGTLIHDFPSFLPGKEPPNTDKEWQIKIALDLSAYKSDLDELSTPGPVVILFPHIEQGRKDFHLSHITNTRKATQALFNNVSQKLTETVILYDHLPLLGFEERELSELRYKTLQRLVEHQTISQIASVLSNPQDCWGDLLE